MKAISGRDRYVRFTGLLQERRSLACGHGLGRVSAGGRAGGPGGDAFKLIGIPQPMKSVPGAYKY